MGTNWINSLDMLADAGVIDYDAPAYIKGTAPRYAGCPDFACLTPDGPKYQKELSKDEYEKIDNKSFINNPGWKKALFTMLALGGIAYGGFKMKAKIGNAVKKNFTELCNWCKNGFKKP